MGITCLYMFATLFATVSLAIARCEVDPAWGKKRSALANTTIHFCREWSKIYAPRQSWGNWAQRVLAANPVLLIAMLQLPLHLYFLIRLRLTNEPLLLDGNDDNEWGFGQIYALITSAGLIVECCKGYLSVYLDSTLFLYKNTQRL